MNYKYKFSIIIAVYNIEEYIGEAIESLIQQQNIIFEKDIQVILVNDGSTDNSSMICKEYRDKYKSNITYIETENRGVSAARNEGLRYVEGKYINFLDGDDKFGDDVLHKVYDFFEKENEYIDIVAIRMEFFEAQQGNHTLNYKFNKTRIVSVLQDYKFIQLSSSSAFVKESAIRGKVFKEQLKYLEDAYLMTDIILDKKCYGVLQGATYYCRKRYNNTSATQNLTISEEWYLNTLREFHLDILEYTERKLGYIPKYVQYLVMYDLQWRIKQEQITEDILNRDQQREYINLIQKVLRKIDNNIIKIQPALWIEHKLYCLRLKYQDVCEVTSIKSKNNIKYLFRDEYIYKLSDIKCNIEFVYEQDNELIIEGFITDLKFIDISKDCLKLQLNDRVCFAKWKTHNPKFMVLNTEVVTKQYFKFNIPIESNLNSCIKIILETQNIEVELSVGLGKHIRLYKDINDSYIETNNILFIYNKNKIFLVYKTLKSTVGREYRFIKNLLKKKHVKIVLLRVMMYIIKKIKSYIFNKEIWIFMDRIDKADDNAEALFKYIQDKKEIKSYFVIKEDSEDIKRLKKIGDVLLYNSIKQKLMMTLANKVISSHADDHLIRPLGGDGKYLASLCNFKFIFLQHGITKDNMSKLFNRYNKNIDLFITSGIKEYESIFLYDYFYQGSQVKLTGFPRHDYLNNNCKKQIVIMPTWRKGLTGNMDTATGKRMYNSNFKETLYFAQYNKLINDEKVIEICKKHGYKILFLPHPNMLQQIEDFDTNEYVEIIKESINYNKIICESDCLITDYSSIAFDFAYMGKPIIYYQFDKQEVLNQNAHTYEKGYFEYEDMGFGPVIESYEQLVNNISELLLKECKMEQVYKKRVSNFCKYIDHDNCKRVYEEIKRMK